MQIQTCPHCGSEVPEDEVSCVECGGDLDSTESE